MKISCNFGEPSLKRTVSVSEAYDRFYKNTGADDYRTRYQLASVLTTIFTKVAGSKRLMVQEVDKIRTSYVTDVIVTQFTEDSLSPDIGTGRVVNIKSASGDERINKEIKYLEKVIDFDQLCKDITPDILLYGDYVLKVDFLKKDKKFNGIQELLDIVVQGDVVPITKGGRIKYYLRMGQDGTLRKKHKASYASFYLDGSRVRIDTQEGLFGITQQEDAHDDPILKEIPRFIRVGKSKIYSIIPKIKELELLEKLVPATKISKLGEGTIVGVRVSEKLQLTEALKTVEQFEGLINKRLAVDSDLGDLVVEDIINAAGRVKVIPTFGDKGTIEKIDYKTEEPDELTASVEELRRIILDSCGIPYELIYHSDSSKQEMLRRHARYLRILRSIQRCLSNGLKQIVYIHLANKGIKFKREDIEVEFLNKLVEVDNLDRLEHADITISSLNNMGEFVKNISSPDNPLSKYVNQDIYAKYVDKNLRTIGLAGLIDIDKMLADKENGVDLNKHEPEGEDAGADSVGLEGEDEIDSEDTSTDVVDDASTDSTTDDSTEDKGDEEQVT